MNAISESLASMIISRACMLDVTVHRMTALKRVHIIGQAGLIQNVDGDFCIISCVHNTMTYEATVAEPNREMLIPKLLVATLPMPDVDLLPYFETMNTPQLQMSNLRPSILREKTEEAESVVGNLASMLLRERWTRTIFKILIRLRIRLKLSDRTFSIRRVSRLRW
jgi:hypothetical protein